MEPSQPGPSKAEEVSEVIEKKQTTDSENRSFTSDPAEPGPSSAEDLSEAEQQILYELERKSDLLEKLVAEGHSWRTVEGILKDPEGAREYLRVIKEELKPYVDFDSIPKKPMARDDPRHLAIKAHCDAKLAKYDEENVKPLEEKLRALKQEMAEFQEATDREVEELKAKVRKEQKEKIQQEKQKQRMSKQQKKSETYEKIQWYKEKIKITQEATKKLRQKNDEEEKVYEEKLLELDALKKKMASERERSASLKKREEDLEEEIGVLQIELNKVNSLSLSEKPHQHRGNSLFAEIEDRKNLLQARIEKMEIIHKNDLITKAKLEVQLARKKKEYEEALEGCKISLDDLPTTIRFERAREAAKRLEAKLPCRSMPFNVTDEDAFRQTRLGQMVYEKREKLEAMRAKVFKVYQGRLEMAEKLCEKRLRLMQRNHVLELKEEETETLMAELERAKARQLKAKELKAEKLAADQKKKAMRTVTFAEPPGGLNDTEEAGPSGISKPKKVYKKEGSSNVKHYKTRVVKSLDDI